MRAHAGLKGAGAFPGSVDPSLSVGLGASISDTEPVRGVGASPGDAITNLYKKIRPEGENCEYIYSLPERTYVHHKVCACRYT